MTAVAAEPATAALALKDLEIVYRVRGRDREVVRGVTLEIGRQESYGLVGESGCGKSTIALAIVRYLPRNGRVAAGGIEVAGNDVGRLRGEALRRYRRDDVSMVYQNPGSAMNPSLRVGRQLAEVFRLRGADRDEAHKRAAAADRIGARRRSPLVAPNGTVEKRSPRVYGCVGRVSTSSLGPNSTNLPP